MTSATGSRTSAGKGAAEVLECGEFVVHYQPKIIIDTDEIAGLEALVRWEHPQWGLLPPAEFVPLADKTGLIMPLGRWVLGEACRQVKEWRKCYPTELPLTLYVNLSA